MKRRNMQTALIIFGSVFLLATVLVFVCSLTANRPANLGITNGQLKPAPRSPNCVSTQAESEVHKIAAFEYSGDAADAMDCLCRIVNADARATIIEKSDAYLYAEFRSRLFRFVDDVEFYVDRSNSQIQFRSASRTGHSDLGVNRLRMERLRHEFAECLAGPPGDDDVSH